MSARPERVARTEAGATSFLGAVTAILLVGGALGLLVLLDVPSRIAGLGSGGLDALVHPTTQVRYGEPVHLDGRDSRPAVEVVAGVPRRVVSRTPGQRAARGNVLVGAPVTIRNVGELRWSTDQGLVVHAYDQGGASYSRRLSVTRTRGARALPVPATVGPGHTVQGLLVFEVPRTVRITSVSLTVGTGMTRTAAWSAPGHAG